VRPDTLLYEQGRIQGLREFCNPKNGYFLGSHGYLYNGQCRGDAEPGFLNVLDLGRKLYYLKLTEIDEQRALTSAYEELEAVNLKIARSQDDWVQEGIGTNIDASQRLIGAVETLVNRKKELRVRINAHQTRLEALRQDIKFMRSGQPTP
jgi:hypothetical protein